MHCTEILSAPSETLCKGLLDWFLMEYLSDYGLDIVVDHKDLSSEGVYGWCIREGDNEFLLEIHNDLSEEEYTKTILHELYHVYQHMTNQPQCELCANLMEKLLLDKYSKVHQTRFVAFEDQTLAFFKNP